MNLQVDLYMHALCNTAPVSSNQVVTVIDDVIVMDIPVDVLSNILKFEVQLFLEVEQRVSKRQQEEPITFTVENSGQTWITIPSDELSTLEKGSTYSVQVSDHVIGSNYLFEHEDYVSDQTSV